MKTFCLFQLKETGFPKGDGIGDCQNCRPDRGNERCRGFIPVTVCTVEIYGGPDDGKRLSPVDSFCKHVKSLR